MITDATYLMATEQDIVPTVAVSVRAPRIPSAVARDVDSLLTSWGLIAITVVELACALYVLYVFVRAFRRMPKTPIHWDWTPPWRARSPEGELVNKASSDQGAPQSMESIPIDSRNTN